MTVRNLRLMPIAVEDLAYWARTWACRIDNSRGEWNRLVYSFDEDNLYIWQARYHYTDLPNQTERERLIRGGE